MPADISVESIVLRAVDKFDEPLFTQLAERVFGDGARRAAMERLCPDQAQAAAQPLPLERVRIGAFDGQQLIGWSHGWRLPGAELYVASSAVLPEYRRLGLYTRLIAAIEEQAIALGCQRVVSHHYANNNAVLIAKLKAGYMIAGTEFSTEMGLLVKLVHELVPARAELFAARVAPIHVTHQAFLQKSRG